MKLFTRVARAEREAGIALVVVLLVLAILALIGAPFVVSMMLHDRASQYFSGALKARLAAESARNHAIAQLEATHASLEWERDQVAIENERKAGTNRRSALGRGREERDDRSRGGRRIRGREESRRTLSRLPEYLRESRNGPSSRDHDAPGESAVAALGRIELPENAPEDLSAREPRAIDYASGDGITASVEVADEQAKIHLDTAPPHLIANVFGVTQLSRPFHLKDESMFLDDVGPFRGDEDPGTLDGAVVLIHPASIEVEVVTYREKKEAGLAGLFRGGFFSRIPREPYPAGTFVQDLKGWKVGFHKLWSPEYGGFAGEGLTRLRSVEAIREIAHWQVASLFVNRFHGAGLTADLLRASGVRARELERMGLDPAMFQGEVAGPDLARDPEYQRALRTLRRLRFDQRLIDSLETRRGPRAVTALAARLDGAKRADVEAVEREIGTALRRESEVAKDLRLDSKAVRRLVAHLEEVYRTAGIETLLAEDLEYHRDAFTVGSRIATLWSEPQAVIGDVSLEGPHYDVPVPRASDFNRGTVVRILPRGSRDSAEINVVVAAGGGATGVVRLAFPPRKAYRAYEAVIQALERHPVNVNSATRRVLRALFTGVRGRDPKQVVTPYEADRLAEYVLAKVPITGHKAFYDVLESAVKAKTIDPEDMLPLFTNAVQPANYALSVSTTGLCYATADVYTMESRAVLRAPAGGEIAHARFREVVEVSPAGIRRTGLSAQSEFAEGIYLQDVRLSPGYPEYTHPHLLRFPGTLSHLVTSRPLLLHGEPRIFPGADAGSLRLLASETPMESLRDATHGEVLRFEDTYEGLELAPGEPYSLDVKLAGGGANASAAGAGAVARIEDLTMVPAGLEFWFRMRTVPLERTPEGYVKLVEGGSGPGSAATGSGGPERNKLALLYDEARGRLLLRIHDSSLGDPLLPRGRQADTGPFLELRAERHLELHTWYHIRLAWDGAFGGGAQLFVDGIPLGADNLSTRLAGPIPATGQVSNILVEDASRFPEEGVVRIGSELFEYSGRSGNSLRIRQTPPSHWKPLPVGGGVGVGLPGGGTAPVPGPVPGAAPTDPRLRSGRGSVPAAHPTGSAVTLHGYSLEIRRKIGVGPGQQGPAGLPDEFQVPDGDAQFMVWGPGGLSLREPLNAWNFPPSVEPALYHFFDRSSGIPQPPGQGGPGGGQPPPPPQSGWIVVPVFRLASGTAGQVAGRPGLGGQGGPGAAAVAFLTGQLPGLGRTSIEYFQTRGICHFFGKEYRYERVDLEAEYTAALARDSRITNPPTQGLRLMAEYPAGSTPAVGAGGAAGAGANPQAGPASHEGVIQGPLLQLSLIASGSGIERYPPTGVLEVRGAPAPWETWRPNLLGQPLLGNHPDDTVEWLRYRSIDGDLFVGRLTQRSNFRGYPVREPWNHLKKQLDLPAGQPLRLVMELGQGGAGPGDFVTITTSDPNVFEPGLRRVYRSFEHEDGRFFVSLLDVNSRGRELPASAGAFKNKYFRVMNPRLVKFPSWGLPEIGSGTVTLFGHAADIAASQPASRRSERARRFQDLSDDAAGITLDEVRRFQNRHIPYYSTYGPRVRHLLVPLENGRVKIEGASGQSTIGGAILKGDSITRSNPREVFIVAVSTEPIAPTLFAAGLEEGVLRIGSELFYFESDGLPFGTGQATRASVASQSPAQPPGAQVQVVTATTLLRERATADRMVMETVPVNGRAGHFEPEGFATIRDLDPERSRFSEVFYYGASAGGFTNCLRGQFNTPYLEHSDQWPSPVYNATRRIRLVGRGLLGTEPVTHSAGDPVALVPYITIAPLLGPMVESGLPVKNPQLFARGGGYVLVDGGSASAGRAGPTPWEILTHLGPQGDGSLLLPRDEAGDLCLRARFGTQPRPITGEMFAYELPFRYFDRFEPKVESEHLAFLQKSFREPGAFWRALEWTERPDPLGRERLADIVVVARFDGEPDWSVEADPGGKEGLYLLESRSRRGREAPVRFELGRSAGELEIRIYFRYKSGAFLRVDRDTFRDDWKHTPVLESLVIEYEKGGAVLRHEELPR